MASLELGIGYPKVTNHDITTYLSAPCVLRSKRRHVETEPPPSKRRYKASGCLHLRARLQAPLDDDVPSPPATLLPRILHHTHTLDVTAPRLASRATCAASQASARQKHALQCRRVRSLAGCRRGHVARNDRRTHTIEERETPFWRLVVARNAAIQRRCVPGRYHRSPRICTAATYVSKPKGTERGQRRSHAGRGCQWRSPSLLLWCLRWTWRRRVLWLLEGAVARLPREGDQAIRAQEQSHAGKNRDAVWFSKSQRRGIFWRSKAKRQGESERYRDAYATRHKSYEAATTWK